MASFRRTSNKSWIDQITNKIINMDKFWDKGQPDGTDLQPCSAYDTASGKYHDVSCSYKSCFVCGWNDEPVFTLRHELFYFLCTANISTVFSTAFGSVTFPTVVWLYTKQLMVAHSQWLY